jgi:hypothetical protein
VVRLLSSWTAIPAYGHGGLVVAALAVVSAALLTRASGRWGSQASVYVLVAVAALPVLAELVLTTWYLLSPTYLDHIEASTASAAQYYRQGIALYPDPGSYTFHGLLYGPLLAELNSLGYLFGSGVFASKLIGWVAAWVAVGLLMGMPPAGGYRWHWVAATATVVCVLASFGSVLTADRADSLLILCATAGFFCVLRTPGLISLAVAAALAGAAASLKPHGPVYLVPALYSWARGQTNLRLSGWLTAAAVATAAGLLGIGLPFLPGNVSLQEYLVYLGLGARHGLAWGEFGWNIAFLASLWAPVALIFVATRVLPAGLGIFTGVLLAVESLVAVIAAKPGAGIHHLLPFLCFHAFLLQRMLAAASEQPQGEPRALQGATVALAVVLLGTAWPAGGIFRYLLRFDLQLPLQHATLTELSALSHRYPGGMLGISDASSYALTSFRPWLTLTGTRQTDYGALMDLRLSGVTDTPLAMALARCDIPYLFMPKPGEPFTMMNRYGGPMFSEAVRAEFLRHYSLLEAGKEFNVYGCSP